MKTLHQWFINSRKATDKIKARFWVAMIAFTPLLARADWTDTANDEMRKFRIGVYTLCGSVALISLCVQGGKWVLARMQGDHSTTAMDYMSQVAVIVVVAGSVALGTYAWGVFGTGSPA